MNFLNPFVLFGLFASSIPIILHLLNLRKQQKIEFSTLRFLKELQKNKIRRLKIKQWILLALRTLIIILAVIAFARPTIESDLPYLGTTAKTSSIILIDDSYSMDLNDESGNRLNRAKRLAQNISKNLKEGDQALLMKLSDLSEYHELSNDTKKIKNLASGVQSSNITPNIINALRTANSIIDESNNPNKEVYLISDFQPNLFEDENSDTIKFFKQPSSLYFIHVGQNKELTDLNLSIDSIDIISKIIQRNKPLEIDVAISNRSKKNANSALISLYYNNERVAQRTIDIPASTNKIVNIAAPPTNKGLVKARVELEQDGLLPDNKYYFGFIIPDKPLTAVFCGDDTKKIINAVLQGGERIESPANAEFYATNQIESIDLNRFDVVLFAGNIENQSSYARIKKYLEKGGAVLLFADSSRENNEFIRGMDLIGIKGVSYNNYSANSPDEFVFVDKVHPLFEGVFKGTTNSKKIIESPKIYYSYCTNSGIPIIKSSGGNFLSEHKIGAGKLIYSATSLNNQSSTFAMTGLFPSMLYRSIAFLNSDESSGIEIIANEREIINIPSRFAGSSEFKIIDPNDQISYAQFAKMPSGLIVEIKDLDEFGVYELRDINDNIVNLISVNPNPTESNSLLPDEQGLRSKFDKLINSNSGFVVLNDSTDDILKNIKRARTGTELWSLFIMLAILLAVTELIVASYSKKDISE